MQKVLDRQLQLLTAPDATEEAEVDEGVLHRPVLLREAVRYLAVRPGGVYVDCTAGEGGHASAILQSSFPGGQLLGIDLDPDALERAQRRLQSYAGSFTLSNANYSRVKELANALGLPRPDGILLDLGMSSFQLESIGRGFSLQRDEPLDMRYDTEAPLTAADIVNGYRFEDLVSVLSGYGEEPRSRSVARAIIERRPLRTTVELADLVTRVRGGRRGRIHPATRVFQALRIAVNSELGNLRGGLQQAIELLKTGGMLVVISYHSLEDRIVKQTMAREARACICPPRIPICSCGHSPSLRVISKKVVTPSPEEIVENPRSRSARLRAAERLYGK